MSILAALASRDAKRDVIGTTPSPARALRAFEFAASTLAGASGSVAAGRYAVRRARRPGATQPGRRAVKGRRVRRCSGGSIASLRARLGSGGAPMYIGGRYIHRLEAGATQDGRCHTEAGATRDGRYGARPLHQNHQASPGFSLIRTERR